MPAKTIYVRDGDAQLWQKAEKLGEGSISQVLTDALRAHLNRLDDAGFVGAEAPHGDKTIKLTLAFWTDSIAPGAGKIVPRHAWSNGQVTVRSNDAHGISNQQALPFNSLMELPLKIEEALRAAGVTLHLNERMSYLQPRPAPGKGKRSKETA